MADRVLWFYDGDMLTEGTLTGDVRIYEEGRLVGSCGAGGGTVVIAIDMLNARIAELEDKLKRRDAECAAWRCGNLCWDGCAECSDVVDGDGNHYDTIPAAVDALVAEEVTP